MRGSFLRLDRLEREVRRGKILWSSSVAVLGLLVLLGVTGGRIAFAATDPAEGFQAELQRYRRALEQVCEAGVTPELVKLYEVVVEAVDASKYGSGLDSNFWGPQHPEVAYHNCFPAPSGP